jgi:hypothetical protein
MCGVLLTNYVRQQTRRCVPASGPREHTTTAVTRAAPAGRCRQQAPPMLPSRKRCALCLYYCQGVGIWVWTANNMHTPLALPAAGSGGRRRSGQRRAAGLTATPERRAGSMSDAGREGGRGRRLHRVRSGGAGQATSETLGGGLDGAGGGVKQTGQDRHGVGSKKGQGGKHEREQEVTWVEGLAPGPGGGWPRTRAGATAPNWGPRPAPGPCPDGSRGGRATAAAAGQTRSNVQSLSDSS